MELIKKQINIDECISHKAGTLSFIPCDESVFISDTDEISGITSGTSNYGHFVCDLSGETGIIKYLDIIDRYNCIKNILRDSYYCRCITLKNDKKILKICNNINTLDIECEDACKDKTKPYDFTPLDMSSFKMEDNNTFIPLSEVDIIDGSFYVLVTNFNILQKHEEWGAEKGLTDNSSGDNFTFLQYVDAFLINNVDKHIDFTLIPPSIEFPILLEEEYTVNTLYYPYEYSLSGNSRETIEINGEIFEAIVGTEVVPFEEKYIEDGDIDKTLMSGVSVSSRLNSLIHPLSLSIAKGFNGILKGWEQNVEIDGEDRVIEGGQLFKCIFYTEKVKAGDFPNIQNNDTYQIFITLKKRIEEIENKGEENEIIVYYDKYYWWECVPINDEDIVCGDDLEDIKSEDESDSTQKYYRNLTILSCMKHYVPFPSKGDIYYFMARYQNGKINPEGNIGHSTETAQLELPFKVGEPINIQTCADGTVLYDQVLTIDKYDIDTEHYCQIKYVIGATSGIADTGIFYVEDLRYTPSKVDVVWIDGVIESELYYEELDYETNSIRVMNKDYNIMDKVSLAKIEKIETFNYNMYQYPLITKEGCEKMYFTPKMSADVIFNRGNAGGWDKFFKLTECNTMQDLENYSNNIFNL